MNKQYERRISRLNLLIDVAGRLKHRGQSPRDIQVAIADNFVKYGYSKPDLMDLLRELGDDMNQLHAIARLAVKRALNIRFKGWNG